MIRIILKEDHAVEMNKRRYYIIFLNCLIFAGTIFSCPVRMYAGELHFLSKPYWNSGKAEFQTYKAKIKKYGYLRNAQVKIIIVKEPFDLNKRVKSLTAAKVLDVIKMNYIQTVSTGVYDYNQMVSIFFDRSSGRTIKFTMSSQDGCGNSYMQYDFVKDNHNFIFNSYFDDEGQIYRTMKGSNPIFFYDALPISLRFRLKENKPYRIKIFPGFVSNKFIEPKPYDVNVSQTLLYSVEFNNILYKKVYSVTVASLDKKDVFYFNSSFPYSLIKWEMNTGDELNLDKTASFNYWEYLKPGDVIPE